MRIMRDISDVSQRTSINTEQQAEHYELHSRRENRGMRRHYMILFDKRLPKVVDDETTC